VGGEGKVAEVDGGYFGGYVKLANMKADRLDRRFTRNQSGKRKVVVILRARRQLRPSRVRLREPSRCCHPCSHRKATTDHADEAHAWDNLHERFEVAHQSSRGVQPRRRLHQSG
jgi:ISXO2 transposase-like protein